MEQQNLRYPNGYWPLFGSEIVSRFGFWTVQSLLVLYLVQFFHFSDKLAYSFFSSYSALTYAVTIIGGVIADKLMGFKQPVIIGAFTILLGSLVLTIPQMNMNEVGLSLVILGTGLMIPNIANFIGALYRREDTKRDKGFSTFYIATNLGGLGGPIIASFVNQFFGWQAAFGSVAIFMLVWLAIYLFNYKKYTEFQHATSLTKQLLAYGTMLSVVIINYVLLRHGGILGYLLSAIFIVSLLYVFFSGLKAEPASKNKLIFIIICIFLALYFFTFEFQILTSFIIFTQKFVNSSILGFQLPVTSIVAIEPMFVVLLIPVINMLFDKLSQRGRLFNQFEKITYGMACLAICFLIFAIAAHVHIITNQSISLLWVFGALIVMAAGEVLIMPPLLSAITKDAPEQLKGTLVGVLYLAIALSGYLSGQVAKLTESFTESTSTILQNNGYYHTYIIIFAVSIVLTIGLYGIQKIWNLRKV
jgi:POT family proton-dependent oligopeptide transporter